jgi:hypothetical protein
MKTTGFSGRLLRLAVVMVPMFGLMVVAQAPPPTPPPPVQPGQPAQGPGGRGTGGGGTLSSTTNAGADFSPKAPIVARTPDEQAKAFILPPGYRMELVVAEPEGALTVTVRRHEVAEALKKSSKYVGYFMGELYPVAVGFAGKQSMQILGSMDGTLWLWENPFQSDKSLPSSFGALAKYPDRVSSVAMSEQGFALSATSSSVTLWDLNSRQEIKSFQGHGPVCFSEDGKLGGMGSGDAFVVFELDSGKILLKTQIPNNYTFS